MIQQLLAPVNVHRRFANALVAVIGFIIFTRFWNVSSAPLVGLVLVAGYFWYQYEVERTTISDFVSITEAMMNELDVDNSLPNIYSDANLIHLLYSIRDFRDHAPRTWVELLSALNDFYQLSRDFEDGVVVPNESQYEVAVKLHSVAVNSLHAFVYSMPYTDTNKTRLQTSLQRLRVILHRQMDRMNPNRRFKPKPYDGTILDSLAHGIFHFF